MLFQRKKQCIPFTGAIKLILITDTHVARPIDQNCMDKAEAFGYDAVILMGDYSGQEKNILKENVRADQLFCLFGNHDGYDAADYFQANDLHEKVAVVNGVRIAGIGGCLKYNEFVSGYENQKESRMAAEKMPPADILITHASAYRKNENNPVHKGLKGITDYIEKNRIPFHFHGHDHEKQTELLPNGCISYGLPPGMFFVIIEGEKVGIEQLL